MNGPVRRSDRFPLRPDGSIPSRLTRIPPRALNDLQAAEAPTADRIAPARRNAANRFRIGYSRAVSTNVSIEVDKHTADALQMRAAELGVAVPQLIAELATLDSDPRHAGLDEVAELDRRYARATEGSRVPGERASTTV